MLCQSGRIGRRSYAKRKDGSLSRWIERRGVHPHTNFVDLASQTQHFMVIKEADLWKKNAK